MIFKIITFIFISIILTNVFASEITGTKETPIELNYLLQSYQTKELSENEYKQLLNKIKAIDTLFSLATKEEIFFIIKSEIYKTILKFGPTGKMNFDQDDFAKLKLASIKSKDPFIKWLLTALSADVESIFSSSNFKEYQVQKKNGKYTSNETKKIAKKIQLISKIFSQINLEDPDNLKNDLISIYDQCLTNIEESLFLLIHESKFDISISPKAESKNLAFFKISEENIAKPSSSKQAKSVEDILGDDIENLEPKLNATSTKNNKLPLPVSEDWNTEDNSPIDLKKLPKPSNDADWLQDF